MNPLILRFTENINKRQIDQSVKHLLSCWSRWSDTTGISSGSLLSWTSSDTCGSSLTLHQAANLRLF